MNQVPPSPEFAPLATRVLTIDPHRPDSARLAEAAAVLRRGGLVAFPTETVYGLGAHALDAAAVARIFAAKGRPATNPVIVHVADAAAARTLAADWPDTAERLAAAFWPGPLTLVVRKANVVPSIVTAGGTTAGLRVPAHPVALALLREARLPVAAPSANRSNRVSPTTAQHVLDELAGRLDLVLDGGPADVGLESTVVDLTGAEPVVLRPGCLTAEQLAACAGCRVRYREAEAASGVGPERSPGRIPRHYAPAVPLELVAAASWPRVMELLNQGETVGWVLALEQPPALAELDDGLARAIASGRLIIEALGAKAPSYARQLYAALHRLGQSPARRIVVERPPDGEQWRAVHDRLSRAARSG